MNLRKDHYHAVGGWEPLTGTPPPPYPATLVYRTCCLGGPAAMLPGELLLPGPVSAGDTARTVGERLASEHESDNNPVKTFNNGSLGSDIDEERSEMR